MSKTVKLRSGASPGFVILNQFRQARFAFAGRFKAPTARENCSGPAKHRRRFLRIDVGLQFDAVFDRASRPHLDDFQEINGAVCDNLGATTCNQDGE